MNCPYCNHQKVRESKVRSRQGKRAFHCPSCETSFFVQAATKQFQYAKSGNLPTQDWPVYNKSQEEEKRRFLELLADLVDYVDEPTYQFGRPKLSQKDLLFASALKVYSHFSLRRFMSDLQTAREKGFVEKAPCFASVGHFIHAAIAANSTNFDSAFKQFFELLFC